MYGLPRVRAITAVAVVLIQLLSVGVLPGANGQEAVAQEGQTQQLAPNRFIVRLKEDRPGFSTAASVASTYAAKPGVEVDQIYSNIFDGFAGEFTITAAAALLKDPNVQDVFPDRISTLQAQYDLPGIQRVGADLNPTHAGNGSGTVNVDVAVIDTGVAQHEDLNVYRGKDCTITRATDAFHDYLGHGTHVAGSVGAMDNGIGVVGVAPGARIWAVKVFSRWPTARPGDDLGLGSYLRAGLCTCERSLDRGSEPEHRWLRRLRHRRLLSRRIPPGVCRVVDAGVTVVVAAGNSHQDSRLFVPAQFNEVITVSAYYDSDGQPGGLGFSEWLGQTDDQYASFSNYGTDVDIAAPGVGILSTASQYSGYQYCEALQYCYMSGTSMAAPHVAGGAALVMAQQGRMSPASVRARLQMTGMPGGLPGDPDSTDEPLINVAYLGTGSITAPTTTEVGKSIQIRVSGFTPETRTTFRFKGVSIGSDVIDDAGRGSRNYVIPEMAQGTYKATASNGLKSVSKDVKVVSSMSLNRQSAPAQETVVVTLHGFGSGETVLVEFDGRDMGTTTVTSKGYGQVSFLVPFSVGGWHRSGRAETRATATP